MELTDGKILVLAYAGSHLFGTNTPNSDIDYKGIYIPTQKDLLLQQAKATISSKRDKAHGEKNTKDDTDIELFSIQKFFHMLYEGQTVALELLWTPDELIVEQDPMWENIRFVGRNYLMHKKVTSFVGYCKTQADKYGVKGSRMAAVKEAINELNRLVTECPVNYTDKLNTVWSTLKDSLGDLEHIEFGTQETAHGTIPYMQICERKYQDNQSVVYTLNALQNVYDSYGARARQAETNEGVDFKALSHAYRVCCQAIELLSTGKMTLPLKKEDLEIVRNVKLGLIPFLEFQPMLEDKLAEVLKWEALSALPAEFDKEKWCETFLLKIYETHFSKNNLHFKN